MDGKAEEYLKRQKSPQKEICNKLREMILKNFPEIEETVMSEGLWYEGKFYLAVFKDHVNLGVGISGLNEEELKNFEGKGKSMRHLKFFSADDIDEKRLLKLMQLVYEKSSCTCKIKWRKTTD